MIDPPQPMSNDLTEGQVTVVIPTYNRRDRLSRTLSTALDQREVAIEVVVVDDGSNDGSQERLQDLAATDVRVRVVRHPKSSGVAVARNDGIYAARGEWIAFLDDDDLWSPDKLRCQIDAMREVDALWAYSAAVFVDEHVRPTYIDGAPDPDGLLAALLVEQLIPAGASNVIVRTELVRSLGGFDEALAHLADWDLWIRLAEVAAPARCTEVLVAYVEHDTAMHLDAGIESVYGELAHLEAKHRSARDLRGLKIDGGSISMWIANGHQKAGRRWPQFRVHVRAAIRHRDSRALVRALRAMLPQRPLRPRRLLASPEAPPWLHMTDG